MICFPLDNTPYEAKDMGTYLATRTRGVFSSDGNLAVTPGESGLSVSVSPGLAWLKWSDYWGTAALQEQALTLDLDTADGALKRIDAIVCRLDKVNNRAEIVVKKGAPSSAPIVVPPVRDANYDELYIATVLIGAGVISISASAITDQRLNEEYCGLMRDGVTGIPTASLHAQAQQILTELTDALNAQIVRQSAEFDVWFEDLKGKLGEDPATALQQQVDNLNAAVVGDAFQASGTPVSIAYAGANRIDSLTLYGETTQGGTTEAPVALTGVDNVFVGDNNLLPKATETRTLNGVTFTPNPDGSVSVSGTATSDTSYPFKEGLDDSLFGQTVCLSGGSIQTQLVINEKKHSGEWVRNVIVNAKIPAVVGVLSKQADDNILYGTIYVPTGTTVNTTIYPMLNLGNTAMPYEPYQGSVTPIPIPRPLHEVGDVRDVCRTRVKSVYDKRIVLDGTENWKMGGAFGDGAPYIFCDLLNDHYQAFPIISSRIPSTNILASNKNQGIGCWDRSLYLRYDSLFTNVEELKTYLSAHPLTVYYQSTAYDGTNGLDVCLMKYQTSFVEPDGTEGIEYQSAYNRFAYTLPSTAVNDSGFCSHYKKLMTSAPGEDKYIVIRPEAVYFYDSQYTNADAFNAYLAAQKEAGTPIQVAYQLATPEICATDPLDIDNAAGPLTIMTGGEVEVRMTELIGSRTYDADGDGVVDKAAAVPWDGVTGKPGTFTPSAHTHDDRYYTETEMNTKLNGKANSSHTHTKDQVGLSKVNNNAISMGYDGNLWISFS